MDKKKIYKKMNTLKITEKLCMYCFLLLIIPFLVFLTMQPSAEIVRKRNVLLIVLGAISALLVFVGAICSAKFLKLNNQLFLDSFGGKNGN